MNISSNFSMLNQSFLKPRGLEQKSSSFNDSLLTAKSSSTIKESVSTSIDRSLKDFTKPIKSNFSYQSSAEVVSQRLQRKDFSIFMPPSANAYKD
jgi:hypothetical protein